MHDIRYEVLNRIPFLRLYKRGSQPWGRGAERKKIKLRISRSTCTPCLLHRIVTIWRNFIRDHGFLSYWTRSISRLWALGHNSISIWGSWWLRVIPQRCPSLEKSHRHVCKQAWIRSYCTRSLRSKNSCRVIFCRDNFPGGWFKFDLVTAWQCVWNRQK